MATTLVYRFSLTYSTEWSSQCGQAECVHVAAVWQPDTCQMPVKRASVLTESVCPRGIQTTALCVPVYNCTPHSIKVHALGKDSTSSALSKHGKGCIHNPRDQFMRLFVCSNIQIPLFAGHSVGKEKRLEQDECNVSRRHTSSSGAVGAALIMTNSCSCFHSHYKQYTISQWAETGVQVK